jgi:hypothetical protein
LTESYVNLQRLDLGRYEQNQKARAPAGVAAMDLIWQLDSRRLRLAREALMAQDRRIVWLNVVTVVSAAILIGAEVFGAAFAGSWALATLFDLGSIGQRILDALFVLGGIAIMVQFVRNAHRIEPFTARD